MGLRQFRRSMAVQFGVGSQLLAQLIPLDPEVQGLAPGSQLYNLDDNGLRMAFNLSRNNRGEPDKGTLRIWNLREKIRNAILNDMDTFQTFRDNLQKAPFPDDKTRAAALLANAESYRITIYAGYQRTMEIVFIGQMVNVTPSLRDGDVDIVTVIELGDSIEGFRSGYVNQVFGTGTTMANITELVIASAGWRSSKDVAANISIVAPNAVLTFAEKGFYAVGRPAETIDEIAELFGVQWFVRDGEVFFAAQNTILTEPPLVLQEGVDLLAFASPKGFGDVRGRALLNPRLQPGAGLIILDGAGKRLSKTGFRVNSVTHRGDTDGGEWYSEFEAGEIDLAIVSPDLAFAELVESP